MIPILDRVEDVGIDLSERMLALELDEEGRLPLNEGDFEALADRVAAAVRLADRAPASPEVAQVEGDAMLLEWALEVLVKNAVDALAGRGGQISVAVRRAGDGLRAQLLVSDDGPGIARDLRGRIFEPGFSTKKRGWGIGLSLARRIIEENHGGTLQLATADRGAAFEIILP